MHDRVLSHDAGCEVIRKPRANAAPKPASNPPPSDSPDFAPEAEGDYQAFNLSCLFVMGDITPLETLQHLVFDSSGGDVLLDNRQFRAQARFCFFDKLFKFLFLSGCGDIGVAGVVVGKRSEVASCPFVFYVKLAASGSELPGPGSVEGWKPSTPEPSVAQRAG